MSWEIKIEGDRDAIINEINRGEKPVAIIIFGADSPLKDSVSKAIVEDIENLGKAFVFDEIASLKIAEKPLGNHENIIVVLNNEFSIRREKRQDIVNILHNYGAEIVIGICVVYNSPTFNNFSNTINKILKENPPTIYDLDYLILVNEDKSPIQ